MTQWFVLSMLYFPEDKSEYIPAAISLFIFSIGAILAMRLIIKISRREAKKTEALEKQIMEQNDPNRNS